MTIVKRPVSAASASTRRGDRLRVITAGRVGNMQARLGTSGFEVVAAAETEDGLIDAVSADDADAIVVEADLCPSLEHVRDLAPDAVLIVVGDRTPAGAMGRIEPGVSGTVMAGLLHALVTDGVGGAVVFGFVPAIRAPGALRFSDRLVRPLLSARPRLVGEQLAAVIRDHAPMAATAVVVTVSATVLLVVGTHAPGPVERRVRPEPVVEQVRRHPTAGPSSTTTRQGGSRLGGSRTARAGSGEERRPMRDASRGPVRHDGDAPNHDGASPATGAAPSATATRPPGVAKGWDRRPPKRPDHGHRNGWTKHKARPHDRIPLTAARPRAVAVLPPSPSSRH